MNVDKIGALVYLPVDKKIVQYSTDSMETFEEIDAYWMQREGLVFYPFDRAKPAYFFGTESVENQVGTFDVSKNDQLSQAEYEATVYMATQEIQAGGMKKVVLSRNE